ncbi:MAG: hypothetical protein IJX61_05490 [Ruminococcus sp.]|nr:hypothetical protein [Ruminococcus sp.]
MAEKKTNWQLLAAVFAKAAQSPEMWDKKTVEVSIIPKLGMMVRDGEMAIAAAAEVSANGKKAEVSLVESDDKEYVLIFPDKETAEKLGENCVETSVIELFRTASVNPKISGLQLVYEVDDVKRTFSAGEISRKALLAALEIGIKAAALEQNKSAE